MLHRHAKIDDMSEREQFLLPAYGSRELTEPLPKYKIPYNEMSARSAYSIVRDELMLDGNSRLNLATFVTTWMEPEARQLMSESFDKNMIDKDEYPQTAEIEMRCVNILANLFHAPEGGQACGCSTIGSSEAAMLGGMALKWKWRERMKAQGKPTNKPNMVMGINVQVCWDKFCRYWEVEPRFVPMETGRYSMNAEEAIKRCDENTIGVVGIMGVTFTGEYEPIKEMNDALDEFNAKTGCEIPIHVDAASGGFVAPFLQPDLEWDFRLKWVKSINVSGHKYGLVYPGVGWAIWRDRDELDEDLIFRVNYLGGDMPTFALSFSRPGNPIVAQYYNFLRLGFDGYRRMQQTCQDIAVHLASELEKMGVFQCLSRGTDIPVLAFKVKDGAGVNFSVFDVSEMLRHRGWLVPAYTMPANCEDTAVLRIVVKAGFSHDMADLLLEDVRRVLKHFEQQPGFKATQVEKKTKVHRHC
ncbi:glutamate decarboxylase [Thermodesulfobacteriota bacterium]